MKLLGFLVILLICTGCSWAKFSDGKTVKPNKLAAIQEKKTNMYEVLKALGAPKAISNTETGPVFIYNYTFQKTFGMALILANWSNTERQSDTVMIFMDRKGIVQKIATDYSADNAQYRMPFSR